VHEDAPEGIRTWSQDARTTCKGHEASIVGGHRIEAVLVRLHALRADAHPGRLAGYAIVNEDVDDSVRITRHQGIEAGECDEPAVARDHAESRARIPFLPRRRYAETCSLLRLAVVDEDVRRQVRVPWHQIRGSACEGYPAAIRGQRAAGARCVGLGAQRIHIHSLDGATPSVEQKGVIDLVRIARHQERPAPEGHESPVSRNAIDAVGVAVSRSLDTHVVDTDSLRRAAGLQRSSAARSRPADEHDQVE
jgi:hypothetical protein